LTSGPFAGDLLTVDVANNDVVRISPPFNSAQPGIDFITNLPGPQGVTVNAAGNVFVSNTDGSIDQFANDGTSLGLFVTTDLHNMNITVGSSRNSFLVTTQEGPIVLVLANGTHTIIGSVTGGDGVTVCPQ
jgi:sugar lactone lactonase YvrE